MVDNPWLMLRCEAPYVLEIDRGSIEDFNGHNDPEYTIDTSLLPEPFIGNPSSAKVALLSLNPGLDPGDAEAHSNPAFKKAICRNLRHERQEYPFYPLNPEFSRTPCAKWWLRKTANLIAECGLERVATGLLVVEWFPYHSQESNFPMELVCDSQRYSCQLAREMSAKGATMMLLRARDKWARCKDGFSNLPHPNSWQNPAMTPKNLGSHVFDEIKKRLCGEG